MRYIVFSLCILFAVPAFAHGPYYLTPPRTSTFNSTITLQNGETINNSIDGTIGLCDGLACPSWGHTPGVGIEGSLEVDGVCYADGGITSGSTITLENGETINNIINGTVGICDGPACPSWGHTPGVGMEGSLEVDGVCYADGGIESAGNINLTGSGTTRRIYSEAMTSDTAPTPVYLRGTPAYSQASVNTAGGDFVTGGGMGASKYTFIDIASGDVTLTTTVSSTAVALVGHAGAGQSFDYGASTTTAATNFCVVFNANATLGSLATCTGVAEIAYIQPKAGLSQLLLGTSSAGKASVTQGVHGKLQIQGMMQYKSTAGVAGTILDCQTTDGVCSTKTAAGAITSYVGLQSYSPFGTTNTPVGATQTIDWSMGNVQALNLASTSGNVAVTFSNAGVGSPLFLKIIQDDAAPVNPTFGDCKWPGGTALALSTAANAVDDISALYDGTIYHCFVAGQDVK
jgi:hypothetical protein